MNEIDPVLALELLPQKIDERKRLIASLMLDLQVVQESPYGKAEEVLRLEEAISIQQNYLALFEKRLHAITAAANGV